MQIPRFLPSVPAKIPTWISVTDSPTYSRTLQLFHFLHLFNFLSSHFTFLPRYHKYTTSIVFFFLLHHIRIITGIIYLVQSTSNCLHRLIVYNSASQLILLLHISINENLLWQIDSLPLWKLQNSFFLDSTHLSMSSK